MTFKDYLCDRVSFHPILDGSSLPCILTCEIEVISTKFLPLDVDVMAGMKGNKILDTDGFNF